MDYTNAIIWYASWPVLIYVSYKFVALNIGQITKIDDMHDKIEELERNQK